MKFTESQLEHAFIALLGEQGYPYEPGEEISRGKEEVLTRINIWNEGALPYGLDAASLKTEHNSRPRNPKIADACFKSGYIDTWGRGTLKILDACKKAGLPEPDIKETNGGIAVTLYMRKDYITSGEIRNDFGMISERIRKEFGTISHRMENDSLINKDFFQGHFKYFTEYLKENFGISSEKLRKSFGISSTGKLPNISYTLFIIALYPEVTAVQIGKMLDVSDRSVESYFQKLKSEGMIERVGGKKEGSWQIKQMNL